MSEEYVIIEKQVPPRTTMVINGRIRHTGYKYKVKVKKTKPEGGEK